MEYSEIGVWSEAKLAIVRKYAKAYSTILSKQEKLTTFTSMRSRGQGYTERGYRGVS